MLRYEEYILKSENFLTIDITNCNRLNRVSHEWMKLGDHPVTKSSPEIRAAQPSFRMIGNLKA
jgi:hypothetical protein